MENSIILKDRQTNGAKSGQSGYQRIGHYFGNIPMWERAKPNHLRRIRTGFLS